jgi:hypothetical protein
MREEKARTMPGEANMTCFIVRPRRTNMRSGDQSSA